MKNLKFKKNCFFSKHRMNENTVNNRKTEERK